MSQAMAYKVRLNVAAPAGSATLPIFQLALASGKPLYIARLEVNNESSATSGEAIVELVSSTATAPGTLTAGSAVVIKIDPSNPTQGFTLTSSGFSGALTGTQTTLGRWGFNILNGLLYLPVPEERMEIAAGQFLWVRPVPTVPSANYNVELTVIEEG